MRVAYLHGLESNNSSTKNKWLHDNYSFVFDPQMNYHEPGIFDKVLKQIKQSNVDFIIGSSMGGWFAYAMSTITGIPTILFNPALHWRNFTPVTKFGKKKAVHNIIFGKNDSLIDPNLSRWWIKNNGVGTFKYHEENNTHRTPLPIFTKWVDKIAPHDVNEGFRMTSIDDYLLEQKWNKEVESSHLDEISYDSDTEVLTVKFWEGSVYEYPDVPKSVFRKFADEHNIIGKAGKYIKKGINKLKGKDVSEGTYGTRFWEMIRTGPYKHKKIK